MKTKTIAITGGAGQIAYSLLFHIASGNMAGEKQRLRLHIYDLPEAFKILNGIKMELEDCAFPLLEEIVITDKIHEAFDGADIALLIGAKPRGPGMARGDLLAENGKIFISQGTALNEVASRDAIVFVVGNPCNTNCLIAMHHAPKLQRKNFHAMTRLDQNRAAALLAKKASVAVKEVNKITIWGNHSSTQVPDFVNGAIQGKPITAAIADLHWLENEFVTSVQNRGAAIIEARGKSSAASAAVAVVDAIKSLLEPSKDGSWFSSGVCSDGNPYGIEEGLIFSFPCRSRGDGDYTIVEGLEWNEWLKTKIKASEKELIEERSSVNL